MTTSIVIGRDSTDKGQDCLGILGLAKNSNCTAFTVCFELSAGERGHSLPASPGVHWNSVLSLSGYTYLCSVWTAICDHAIE